MISPGHKANIENGLWIPARIGHWEGSNHTQKFVKDADQRINQEGRNPFPFQTPGDGFFLSGIIQPCAVLSTQSPCWP